MLTPSHPLSKLPGQLILDLMGGDYAPLPQLEGALQALPELLHKRAQLVLLGDAKAVDPHLRRRRFRPLQRAIQEGHVEFKQAEDQIGMSESIRSIRSKPDSSINIGCKLAAEGFRTHRPVAFVSAGHSGAMMVAAVLQMGRLPGVERPAIAVKLPTLNPEGCVVLDVGANVDCKPEHLRDFAMMGALFSQAEMSQPRLPRVALLSNGEERSKGNEQTRAAFQLIESLRCFQDTSPQPLGKWIGYTEGKEIFKGQVDVVVTDGFVGNIMLKAVEGLGSAVVSLLKKEARTSLLTPLGFLLAANAFRRLKKKLDYAEYGAAPLLGVAGYAMICHGRSNSKAIKNALLRTHTALENQMVEKLARALQSEAAGSSAPDLQAHTGELK